MKEKNVKFSNGVIAEVTKVKVDSFDLPTFDENSSTPRSSDVKKKTIEYKLILIHNKYRIAFDSRVTFDINRSNDKVIRWKRVLFEPDRHFSDSNISEVFSCLNHYNSTEVFENDEDSRYFFSNGMFEYEAY